jgi:hypothetical protein
MYTCGECGEGNVKLSGMSEYYWCGCGECGLDMWYCGDDDLKLKGITAARFIEIINQHNQSAAKILNINTAAAMKHAAEYNNIIKSVDDYDIYNYILDYIPRGIITTQQYIDTVEYLDNKDSYVNLEDAADAYIKEWGYLNEEKRYRFLDDYYYKHAIEEEWDEE